LPELPPGPANLHLGPRPRSPLERKWWLWGVEREMARRGIELFHGTDFAVPYLPRRPSVMTLHDLTPWMREWQPRAARIRRRTPLLLRLGIATAVITPSEAIRRAAIERFGLAADRVAAVPLAANSCFRPVPTNAPRPYFLWVGTLEPRKNLDRLIRAWRSLGDRPRVELAVAGRVRSDFTPPPQERGLRLLGPVPERELPELYSGALALVYPSLYEGFGLPVLEAMQCGTLAITSRDPAIMEVAAGGAIHVDVEDQRALAEALAAVAMEPEKFSALRTRALQRSRDFTWRRTAQRTREIYDAAWRRFGRK
jgi:alpha-1,3-rhamnosyl/mannosyltransferase